MEHGQLEGRWAALISAEENPKNHETAILRTYMIRSRRLAFFILLSVAEQWYAIHGAGRWEARERKILRRWKKARGLGI